MLYNFELPFLFGMGMMFFLFPIFLLLGIFWIWMLIDCLTSKLETSEKLLWTLVIVFGNILGALVYLFVVKMKGRNKLIKASKKGKNLYRSKKNRVIAGVCGGIGEYFEVDPTIVRVLWVIFVFLKGAGILAYLICWAIIPEKR